MKHIFMGAPVGALKVFTAAMLSLFLVACGGGGTSGDTPDVGLDTAGDAGTTDLGGDFGLDDGGFVDDGFTDEGGSDDGFVSGGGFDSDGDGISDEDELAVCQARGGSDEFSDNDTWADNCQLRADIDPGEGVVLSPFHNSTYSEGIQRVLFCSGAAGVASSIDAFADGFFGPNTDEAVRAFQQAENDDVMANLAAGEVETRQILVVDGIVGPNTWGRLQTRVEDNGAFITNGDQDDENGILTNFDIFGVLPPLVGNDSGVNCSTQRNFLGSISEDTLVIDGWRLSDVPGGFGISSFSIEVP